MAMELDAMNDCYQRIATGWIGAMPAGQWTSAQLFWAEAGDIVYAAVTGIDREGQPHPVSLPAEAHEALRELRAGMSEPDRGAWLSATATITPEGLLEFAYNWDRRYYWGAQAGFPWTPDPEAGPGETVPSDAQLLDDLALYPREPMFLPSWYPRERVPQADDARASSAAAFSLPPEVQPLMDAWGWPGVVELVRTTASTALGRIPDELRAALDGERGPDARRAALAEFRDGVAGGVLASFDRGGALVPIRLWREHAALTGAAEPQGLAALDDSRPFPAAREEPAMQAILPDLERLVRAIVDADLAGRFGGEASDGSDASDGSASREGSASGA